MKEITGIFAKKKDLDKAFEELKDCGIKQEDVTLLAREKDVINSLGKDYDSVYDLKRGLNVPRMKYMSEKVFYSREVIFITILYYFGIIGAVVTTVAMHESIGVDIAIAFFAGTLMQFVAIVISGFFRKRRAEYVERKLKKGGFLFWIRVDDNKEKKNKVIEVLRKYSAKKIRLVNAN